MSILRLILFSCVFYVHNTYALELYNDCGVIYINNNSEHTLEVNGIYPDSNEKLKTLIIEPHTSQQSLSMKTLRTCAGNTSKIHCHAMLIACHKKINLTVKTIDTGIILLSRPMLVNDSLSFNQSFSDEKIIVLINDVPL